MSLFQSKIFEKWHLWNKKKVRLLKRWHSYAIKRGATLLHSLTHPNDLIRLLPEVKFTFSPFIRAWLCQHYQQNLAPNSINLSLSLWQPSSTLSKIEETIVSSNSAIHVVMVQRIMGTIWQPVAITNPQHNNILNFKNVVQNCLPKGQNHCLIWRLCL